MPCSLWGQHKGFPWLKPELQPGMSTPFSIPLSDAEPLGSSIPLHCCSTNPSAPPTPELHPSKEKQQKQQKQEKQEKHSLLVLVKKGDGTKRPPLITSLWSGAVSCEHPFRSGTQRGGWGLRDGNSLTNYKVIKRTTKKALHMDLQLLHHSAARKTQKRILGSPEDAYGLCRWRDLRDCYFG